LRIFHHVAGSWKAAHTLRSKIKKIIGKQMDEEKAKEEVTMSGSSFVDTQI
jgi:hypothetical protein